MQSKNLNISIYRLRVGSILLAVSLLLIGCAQQLAPKGGPIDTEPPINLTSQPSNFSTNFKSKKVVLEFNEFIKLKNPQDNIIISPVLKYEPNFIIKGKKLIFEIEDTLNENTTYVFNFNEAIVDIHEDNPISGFKYVISTGSYVDSLYVNGFVYQSFKLEPLKGVYVMLYDSLGDSIPYKSVPRYLTKTAENGKFHISNVKQGAYKLFALNDKNRNYLFDMPDEEIGFLDTLIKVNDDSVQKRVNIPLFTEDYKKQYLSKFGSKRHGEFYLAFNRPLNNLKIRELNDGFEGIKTYQEFGKNRDSVIYWLSPPGQFDSLTLEVTTDSIVDTINIYVPAKNKALVEIKVGTNARGGKMELDDSLKISTNRPVEIDTSKIHLTEDSNRVAVTWVQSITSERAYVAYYPWKEESKYEISFSEGAMKDIYGGVNDSSSYKFEPKKLKDYGTLKLKVKGIKEGEILQLLLNNKIVVEEVAKKKDDSFFFNYLTPGSYNLKIIKDVNGNEKWDTGKYLEGIQPEVVIIYQESITIRSNWDQEVDWIIPADISK